MKRVLLVEPHPLTRLGLSASLRDVKGISVVGQVTTADETIAVFDEMDPDVVIIDNHLIGMCGLNLTVQLKERKPGLCILIVSPHEDPLCAERALRAGAQGYVTKNDTADVIARAVRIILDGGYFVSERVAVEIFRAIAHHDTPIFPSAVDILSSRELEIFEMLGEGVSTQDIADRMQISSKTVESYCSRAASKLNASDTTSLKRQAIIWATSQRVCHSWKGCYKSVEE